MGTTIISIIYSEKSSFLEKSLLRAFYIGCQKLGLPCYFGTKYKKAKIFVTYGIYKKYCTAKFNLLHNHMINHEKDGAIHIVVERGFIKRDHYFMVGVGGLNGRAQYFVENSPPDRYWALREYLGEWRIPDSFDKILFALQVPSDSSVQHINYPDFVRQVGIYLTKLCKRFILRYHPLMTGGDKTEAGQLIHKTKEVVKLLTEFGATVSYGRHLYEDLKNSDLMVSFNSNTNVMANLWGFPNIALDANSMVWSINSRSLDEINHPKIPDRRQWVWDLAYKQYTIHEIRQGRPIKRLLEKLNF